MRELSLDPCLGSSLFQVVLIFPDAEAVGSWLGGKPTRTAGAWAPRSGSGAAGLLIRP